VKDIVESDIHRFAERMGCRVVELSVQNDHVYLLVKVPPKISISKLMGTLKGKTAIRIFHKLPQLKRKPYWGNHFWANGYFSVQRRCRESPKGPTEEIREIRIEAPPKQNQAH